MATAAATPAPVTPAVTDAADLAAAASSAASSTPTAPVPDAPATSAPVVLSAATPPIKPAYPPPATPPTQTAPSGVRFDFNQGARILLPERTEGQPSWKVRLRDLDSGNILFESENRGATVASSKRFYVRFRIEVHEGDKLVLEHDYDCRDREVIVQFPIGTLGDTMAWFPYAARFAEVHGCKLICAMSKLIIPLLKDAYPAITFVTHEEMVEQKLPERA